MVRIKLFHMLYNSFTEVTVYASVVAQQLPLNNTELIGRLASITHKRRYSSSSQEIKRFNNLTKIRCKFNYLSVVLLLSISDTSSPLINAVLCPLRAEPWACVRQQASRMLVQLDEQLNIKSQELKGSN